MIRGFIDGIIIRCSFFAERSLYVKSLYQLIYSLIFELTAAVGMKYGYVPKISVNACKRLLYKPSILMLSNRTADYLAVVQIDNDAYVIPYILNQSPAKH